MKKIDPYDVRILLILLNDLGIGSANDYRIGMGCNHCGYHRYGCWNC